MPTYAYICEVCGKKGRAYRPEGQPPRFCSNACKNQGFRRPQKLRKHNITAEADARIRDLYRQAPENGAVARVARELGLPRWKVTRHAISKGYIAKTSKSPDWEPEEESILREYAHRSPENIQKHLAAAGFKRSTTGIVLKRKRLFLPSQLPGYSGRQLAKGLGEDEHFVTRAITEGRLAAERRGTRRVPAQGGDAWYILPDAIRRFIKDYLETIDFRKVDKFFVVDILTRPSIEPALAQSIADQVRDILNDAMPKTTPSAVSEEVDVPMPPSETEPRTPDSMTNTTVPVDEKIRTDKKKGQRKLGEKDHADIRRLKSEGLTNQQIADRYRVHMMTVSKITKGMPHAKKGPKPGTKRKDASRPVASPKKPIATAPASVKIAPRKTATKPIIPKPSAPKEKKTGPEYCRACGMRKIPKRPVRVGGAHYGGVTLTRLCYQCWKNGGTPVDEHRCAVNE